MLYTELIGRDKLKAGKPIRITSKQKMVAMEIRLDRFKCTLEVDTATFGNGLTTAKKQSCRRQFPGFWHE